MDHRERQVGARRRGCVLGLVFELKPERRSGVCSRAFQESGAGLGGPADHSALKQLASHAEGKVHFELAAASLNRLQSGVREACHGALQESRLADPRRSLDRDRSASAFGETTDRGVEDLQFGLAFEQAGARHQSPISASQNSRASKGRRSSSPSPTPIIFTGVPNSDAIAKRDAALGRAVELRQDDARHSGGLGEGASLAEAVLTGGRVDHDQRLVRSALETLARDTL